MPRYEKKNKKNSEVAVMPCVENKLLTSKHGVTEYDESESTHFNSKKCVKNDNNSLKRKCDNTDCKKDAKKQASTSNTDVMEDCSDMEGGEDKDASMLVRTKEKDDVSSSESFDNDDDLEIIDNLAEKYCYENICEESDEDSMKGNSCDGDGHFGPDYEQRS